MEQGGEIIQETRTIHVMVLDDQAYGCAAGLLTSFFHRKLNAFQDIGRERR
ncbi:MAG: hypothetical protein HC794_09815 [Nitrospiraceae bacterium]|nr:hypothetical protein [Nitrospiraceae bacterium]